MLTGAVKVTEVVVLPAVAVPIVGASGAVLTVGVVTVWVRTVDVLLEKLLSPA